MRVIAGSLKGRRLKSPDWPGLRPTADRLRETLFNVLAPRMEGARVADVYAGTGAVGIEALSRGAREVTFIEHDRRAQQLIAANLAHCGVTTSYTIVRASAQRALESFDRAVVFDIVLLDPPYAITDAELAAVLAAVGARLAAGGVAVLEHATRHPVPAIAGRLVRSRDVVAGDSTLTLYGVGNSAAGF
jgi:16S rRNA (guanine966-N2)-methyltransferase